LLRRFRPASDNLEGPEQQHFQDIYDRAHPGRHEGSTLTDYLAVPAVLMKLLFPIIGIAGIYLFLRGHDQPGGGFVAGLTMAVAILVQYMAGGARWVEARLRVHPLRWMGFGLLFAVSAGVIALFSGQSFLTALPAYVTLPWLGTLPLGTVLLFDFGVLALVLGATVLMLIALAHQSLRRIKNPAKAPAHETEVA
jgi:multicomponent K+:H+ antiporter subunit A